MRPARSTKPSSAAGARQGLCQDPAMELRPFGTLTIKTDPDGLYMLGETSVGKRIIQEFLSVSFEGERLRGVMTGKSGADWLTIDDDGHATMDIKVLLLTDDGAQVFVTLDGRAHSPDPRARGAR